MWSSIGCCSETQEADSPANLPINRYLQRTFTAFASVADKGKSLFSWKNSV
jgi:hypothetical protein